MIVFICYNVILLITMNMSLSTINHQSDGFTKSTKPTQLEEQAISELCKDIGPEYFARESRLSTYDILKNRYISG